MSPSLRHIPIRSLGSSPIHLRYLDVGTSRVDEVSYPLSPGVLAPTLADSTDRFRFIACVAELAELLRDSYWARDSSHAKVMRILSTLGPEFQTRPVLAQDDLTLRGRWNELYEAVRPDLADHAASCSAMASLDEPTDEKMSPAMVGQLYEGPLRTSVSPCSATRRPAAAFWPAWPAW